MKIFTIIVTYFGEHWIERCLASLTYSEINNHEIIVIDNGSKDSTTSIIKSQFPNVTLIETGRNLGFGKANNIGLKIAQQKKADYIFLLNQDAWVIDNGLFHLIEIAEKNHNYDIIAPVQYSTAGPIDRKFSNYLKNHNTPGYEADKIRKRLKDIYNTKFVNAGAWLMTKNCIDSIGYFNPIFDHYGEDRNYIDRLIYHDLKAGIVPGSRVIHDRPQVHKKLKHLKKLTNNYYTNILIIRQHPDLNFFSRTLKITNLAFRYIIRYRNRNILKAMSIALKNVISKRKEIKKYRVTGRIQGAQYTDINSYFSA